MNSIIKFPTEKEKQCISVQTFFRSVIVDNVVPRMRKTWEKSYFIFNQPDD